MRKVQCEICLKLFERFSLRHYGRYDRICNPCIVEVKKWNEEGVRV